MTVSVLLGGRDGHRGPGNELPLLLLVVMRLELVRRLWWWKRWGSGVMKMLLQQLLM
jgi:hypothetical protein